MYLCIVCIISSGIFALKLCNVIFNLVENCLDLFIVVNYVLNIFDGHFVILSIWIF